MSNPAAPSVLILGAGVLGASAAFHLSERGVAVTVVERASPGALASGRSFGWVNASYAETPAYFCLRAAAIEEHHRLSERLGGSDFRASGCLCWEEDDAALDAAFATHEAYGHEARVVERAEIARLEPALSNPPQRAILLPQEGACDPGLLAARLLDAASALGATVLTGLAAEGLILEDARIAGIRTAAGEIRADRTVLAAGTAAASLLETAGLTYPMANDPGVLVETLPLPRAITRVLISPELHFRQSADGRVLMGETFGGRPPGTDMPLTAFAAEMVQRLGRLLPGLGALSPGRILLAERPMPADGLPVIGAAPDRADLYILSMHSGATLAPIAGRLAAAEILGEGPSNLLAAFRPGRLIASVADG